MPLKAGRRPLWETLSGISETGPTGSTRLTSRSAVRPCLRKCHWPAYPSFPEISRTLPEFFDPRDPQGLVGLLDRALHDPAWVGERERLIHESFVPTPWTHTAGQLLTAIDTESSMIPEAA